MKKNEPSHSGQRKFESDLELEKETVCWICRIKRTHRAEFRTIEELIIFAEERPSREDVWALFPEIDWTKHAAKITADRRALILKKKTDERPS